MSRKYKSNRKSRKGTTSTFGGKWTWEAKYKAYLEKRQEYIDKGYVLEKAMDQKEYQKYYMLKKDQGGKNINRELIRNGEVILNKRENNRFQNDPNIDDAIKQEVKQGASLQEMWKRLVKDYEDTTGIESAWRKIFYKKETGGIFY